MVVEPRVAESTVLHWRAVSATLSYLPEHAPGVFGSESTARSVGWSFTGHRACTWSIDGRTVDTDLLPGACQVVGEVPVRWLRVREPSECLEVMPSAALVDEYGGIGRLQEMAQRAPSRAPQQFAIAMRWKLAFRAGARHDDLAAEELVRDTLTAVMGPVGERRSARPRLAHVFEYVEQHLAGPVDLTDMAAVAEVSVFHFAREFRAAVGMPPSSYLRARRMERAAELLRSAPLAVAEIARRCGYESTSHFHAAFRRHHGVPPSALRR